MELVFEAESAGGSEFSGVVLRSDFQLEGLTPDRYPDGVPPHISLG